MSSCPNVPEKVSTELFWKPLCSFLKLIMMYSYTCTQLISTINNYVMECVYMFVFCGSCTVVNLYLPLCDPWGVLACSESVSLQLPWVVSFVVLLSPAVWLLYVMWWQMFLVPCSLTCKFVSDFCQLGSHCKRKWCGLLTVTHQIIVTLGGIMCSNHSNKESSSVYTNNNSCNPSNNGLGWHVVTIAFYTRINSWNANKSIIKFCSYN